MYSSTFLIWFTACFTIIQADHPRLSAPVRGQIFTGVLVTEGYGEIFSGEVCNEDSITGRFTAYPGTNFAPIFSPGKSPGKDVPGHLDRGGSE